MQSLLHLMNFYSIRSQLPCYHWEDLPTPATIYMTYLFRSCFLKVLILDNHCAYFMCVIGEIIRPYIWLCFQPIYTWHIVKFFNLQVKINIIQLCHVKINWDHSNHGSFNIFSYNRHKCRLTNDFDFTNTFVSICLIFM